MRVKLLMVLVITMVLVTVGCGGSSTTQTSSSGPGSTGVQAGVPPSTAASASSEKFTRENWGLLATDADKYKGAAVDIVGKVFQSPEKVENGTGIQMWADPKNSEWNTLVFISDPAFQVKDGDYVHVTGTVKQKYEGENAMGGTITATVITADKAEVVDATAAASPPLRTAVVNKSIDQHGLVVTLEKVEYASDETRVFLTVKNDSPNKASFSGYSSKAVQGETQYEQDSSFSLSYPEIQNELLSGIKSAGVITLKAMDPAKEAKFIFEGGSDDYQLDFQPYTFTVPSGS